MSQQSLETGTRRLLTRAEVRRLFRVNEATIEHWSTKGRIRPVGRLPSDPPARPRYEDVFVVLDPQLLERLDDRLQELEDARLTVDALPAPRRGQVLWSLLQRAAEEAASIHPPPPRRPRRRRETRHGLDEDERALLMEGARRRESRRRRYRFGPKPSRAPQGSEPIPTERILSEVHHAAMSLLEEAQRLRASEEGIREPSDLSGPDVVELDPFDTGGIEAVPPGAPSGYELPLPHLELSGPDVVVLSEEAEETCAEARPEARVLEEAAAAPGASLQRPAVPDEPREIELEVLPDDGPVVLDEEPGLRLATDQAPASDSERGMVPPVADRAMPSDPLDGPDEDLDGIQVVDDLEAVVGASEEDGLPGEVAGSEAPSAEPDASPFGGAELEEREFAAENAEDEDVEVVEIVENREDGEDGEDEPSTTRAENTGSAGEPDPRVAGETHQEDGEDAPEDEPAGGVVGETFDRVFSAIDRSAQPPDSAPALEPAEAGPASGGVADPAGDAQEPEISAGEPAAEPFPASDRDEGGRRELPKLDEPRAPTQAMGPEDPGHGTAQNPEECFFGPPAPPESFADGSGAETVRDDEPRPSKPAEPDSIPWRVLEEKLDAIERQVRALTASPPPASPHEARDSRYHVPLGATLVVAILAWAIVAWITTGKPEELILRIVLANLAAAATLLLAPAE